MQYLICYDIAEDYHRRQVAKYLESIAHRQQYSIFMFQGSEGQAGQIRERLLELTATSEHTLLLVVPMCNACVAKLWQSGEALEEEREFIIA